MKNFLKQFIKFGGLVLVVVILLVGAVSYNLKTQKTEKVYAGAGENVTGFAWSENIGWISFNSSNCDTDNNGQSNGGTGCPAVGTAIPSYGTNILDEGGIGKLSGYAWSENIGWISFNRADTVAPPNNDVGLTYGVLAYVDSNNRLQGWARALSACDSVPCTTSGAGTNTGGWDGWMRFTKTTAPAYGVTLTPGSPNGLFSGYAWGSDVLGWISFNCSNTNSCTSASAYGGPSDYKVSTNFELNLTPNAPSGLSVTPQYCDGRLVFSWTFTDPNVSPSLNQQSKYKIDISYAGFGGYSTGEISSGSTSAIINLSNLGSWYGRTLNYTITVWDNAGSPRSASANSNYGPLSNREYPVVDFSWNPTKIFAMQDVNFLDDSICYSSGNTPAASCSVWLWNIPGANYQQSTTSSSRNPIAQFPSPANIDASLTATDSAGNACTATKSININLPLPKIEEKK